MFNKQSVQALLIGIFVYGSAVKITDQEYSLMPKVFHLDNYDDCMRLGEKALYCSVTLQLSPIVGQNISQTWNVIQKTTTDPRYYRHDLLRYGICIPETCPYIKASVDDQQALRNGISQCYTSKLEHKGLQSLVSKIYCETEEERYPIDGLDVTVATVLGVLVLIVFFASFYEGRLGHKPKEEYKKKINTRVGRIIACFSLPKNWERLTRCNTDPNTQASNCLDGIRFILTISNVLGHGWYSGFFGQVDNPPFVENLTRTPKNMYVLNSSALVQTFMIMTSFVLSRKYFSLIEKGTKFQLRPLLLSYINRYIRLTPVLLATIAFSSTWLYHCGNGPVWDRFAGADYRNCRRNWWTNLLYINNVYDEEHMCVPQTWYLATDMQLYFVMLVIIMFIWIFPKKIKLILGLAVVIGCSLPGVISYYYNYDILFRVYPEALYNIITTSSDWHNMISSPFINFGPYAIGMTFGYIYLKTREKTIFTKRIYVAIWMIISFGCTVGVIYSGFFIFQDDYHHTRIGAAVYTVTYKCVFSLGMSFHLYGLMKGIGGMYHDFLIWTPIQILGKLTFCTYLVHISLMRIRVGHVRSPAYLSYHNMNTLSLGDTILSLAIATILTLFVELPASAIHKLMMPQQPSKGNCEEVEEQKLK